MRTDVLTPAQRSFCMSRNRGRNTGPEVRLRRALWGLGLRYRLGSRLPGRPDLVFPGVKLAVFVDGCFWHSCPEHGVMPKGNSTFWNQKLARTKERDSVVDGELLKRGWRVIRLWEHEIERSAAGAAHKVAIALSIT
ncbi:MAG: very short patch repair endonuclease [Alphaproteobacteria bacterium]|nr:very short patch repair endonuclease [Alphaproteobacteria bacterium]